MPFQRDATPHALILICTALKINLPSHTHCSWIFVLIHFYYPPPNVYDLLSIILAPSAPLTLIPFSVFPSFYFVSFSFFSFLSSFLFAFFCSYLYSPSCIFFGTYFIFSHATLITLLKELKVKFEGKMLDEVLAEYYQTMRVQARKLWAGKAAAADGETTPTTDAGKRGRFVSPKKGQDAGRTRTGGGHVSSTAGGVPF